MSVVKLTDCILSRDIIEYKLNDWVDYYKNKYNIIIDKYEYNIDDYQEHYSYESIYCIIYNNKLTGLFIFDHSQIYKLIFSYDSDWYINIKIILNHLQQIIDNELDVFASLYILKNQEFHNIIKKFNATIIYEDNNTFYYMIHMKKYKCRFNKDDINLIIIYYDNYDKINKVFEYNSKIKIIKTKYNYETLEYKTNNHLESAYELILETPMIFKKTKEIGPDLYCDMYVEHGKNTHQLHTKNPSDMRINKFRMNAIRSSILDYYIYSLLTCCQDCKCKSKYHKNELKFPTKSQEILYTFIENNLQTYVKTSPIAYDNIDFSKIKGSYMPISEDIYYTFNDVLELKTKYETINNIKIINNFNYIYLIQKYDMNTNRIIYKFGMTNREFIHRYKEHGKEAKILLLIDTDNAKKNETIILNILNNDNMIIKRSDIGNEYFECIDINHIKNIVINNI
jgi:hypothetical protein